MSPLTTILSVALVAVVLLFLFAGTFFLLFLERLVNARIQHREGPGRGGRTDALQVWKDYRKTLLKEKSAMPFGFRIRAATGAWRVLPALFLCVLLADIWPDALAEAEVPSLLILTLLATALEAAFLHASSEARERYEWRKQVTLRLIGCSVLALSFLAISLHTGSLSLSMISESQNHFPFLAVFSSPGLFLCGLASFGSIYLYSGNGLIQTGGELGLSRSMHYLVFFIRKMWIFCLLCFWVFVFFGGAASIIAKILFPLKVGGALFVFTVLQGSFPRMRSSDAGELAARWMFRMCFLGLFLEAIWVGVWG
jgi:NADH:ubiquinone oxidoreductase subunit H